MTELSHPRSPAPQPSSSILSSQEGTAIEFRNIRYSVYPQQEVLNEFNLAITQGETMVLLGRSGSGKTTALKLINRLLVETSGDLMVEGRATRDWDVIALRRRIGYVIQESGLFPHYNIARNVSLVPRLLGMPAAEANRRADEMLRLVNLEPGEFRNRYPHQLSGGQRQRVGVARALAGDPPILLMDEPFGALDPLSRAEIQRQFQSLQQKLHKTIVLVTHDLREALLLGVRIALLREGKLVGVFSNMEFRNSSLPQVREYLEAFETPEDVAAKEARAVGASQGER